MLVREIFLKKIRDFYHTEEIKVLTGLRRSGKSTILTQIQDEIIQTGIKEDCIVTINFEWLIYEEYREYAALYKYIKDKVSDSEGKVYIFIDEVQEVIGFEKVLNSLRSELDCSIFVTGSNSNLLSGELATLLSGRYVSFEIQPFTYKEYCLLTDTNIESVKNFNEYLIYGGLPMVYAHNDAQSRSTLIKDILESVVYRDIISRNKVNDKNLLSKLVDYLRFSTATTYSITNITNTLKSSGHKTTFETVSNYLNLIEYSYLISTCSRYDVKGKKILKKEEKTYLTDLGLRNALFNMHNIDHGACIETIVYNQLKTFGYEVYVGKLYEKEIDFVIRKGNDVRYIQVSHVMTQNETLEREFAPLLLVKDNYPKYVISLDQIDHSKLGIKHLYLLDFLALDEF